MADKAFITPVVLKWARESAKMSEAIAAAKVSVTVDQLEAWEIGASQPTIKQAQALAKAYKRPFALFFFQRYQEISNRFKILERMAQKP